MDLRKITDYPEHPEPAGRNGEFNREENPRSSPWSLATVGLVTLLLVVIPYPLMWVMGFGFSLGSEWGYVYSSAVALTGLFLIILVFAPNKSEGQN